MTDKTTTDATDTETATAPAVASSLTDAEREAIAQMPYEEARDKLIQAVQALEAGGLNLDQSMRQWEIGEALARRAQTLLGEVRAKLDAALPATRLSPVESRLSLLRGYGVRRRPRWPAGRRGRSRESPPPRIGRWSCPDRPQYGRYPRSAAAMRGRSAR